jgi:hypothetical protein
MTLIPADPRPVTDKAGKQWENGKTEQCPVCGSWLKPQRNGLIRRHNRELSHHVPPFGERCPGSRTEDERVFVVIATGVRLTCTGRRSAEVVAASYDDATIWQEDGS